MNRPLDFPFFTLEYSGGVFVRRLPEGAKDLGGGVFRWRRRRYELAGVDGGGAAAALAEKTICGRALLALARRYPHPLIIEGPRAASAGERIMGLDLAGKAAANRLNITLRREIVKKETWQKIEGLERFRLCGNVIYEIIDGRTIAALAARYGVRGRDGEAALAGEADDEADLEMVLRGDEIPRFADEQPSLVYRFGDGPLRRFLDEKRLFFERKDISAGLLVRAALRRGVGEPEGIPAIKAGGKLFPAAAVSAQMENEYLLLDTKWARRRDLEAAGLNPLGRYSGGAVIKNEPVSASTLTGGAPENPFFSFVEFDAGSFSGAPWLESGTRETVFAAHLEFLRRRGISGGVVHTGGRKEQAELLAKWITGTAELKDAKIVVAAADNFLQLYFYPEIQNVLHDYEMQCVAYEPFFESVRNDIIFGGPNIACDILVAVGAEELDGGERAMLANIKAAVRFDIFSSQGDARPPLFRDTGRNVPLPRFTRAETFMPLEGQKPFGAGAIRFTVEAKFRGIGRTAWHGGGAGIDGPAARARELCLGLGGGDWLESFRELRALVIGNPESVSEMLLIDFAALYGLNDTAPGWPALLPSSSFPAAEIPRDLFILENLAGRGREIGFDVLRAFIPALVQKSDVYAHYRGETEKAFAGAANAIDRNLSAKFGKRLFAFFYPPEPTTEKRTAFEGMENAGTSAYTAEWVHFLGHAPLIDFIGALFRYTEYLMKLKTGFEKPRKAPDLEECWMAMAAAAFAENGLPVPVHAAETGPLRGERIRRLRDDSDHVLKLLGAGEEPETKKPKIDAGSFFRDI